MSYVLIENGAVAQYPYSITDLRISNPDTSFPAQPGDDCLAEFGVYPVTPSDQPAASLVEEITPADPILSGGNWVQQWTVDYLPLEDAREAMRNAIDQRRDSAFEVGFTPSTGPLAGKTLQVRGDRDRTNWLTSQAAYSAAVAAGAGATVAAKFRTETDETVLLSYSDGLAVLLDMAAWGAAVMNNSWTLKDDVRDALDLAALEAIDIEVGWP